MDGSASEWDANAFTICMQDGGREWSRYSEAQITVLLGANARTGLTTEAVLERQQEHGPNELQGVGSRSCASLLLTHFLDFLMILLVASGVVSLAIGEYVDGVVILLISVVNVLAGALQEFRAEKSLEALKSLNGTKAIVLRNGELIEVPSTELVPGEVIDLGFSGAASAIPADARIIETADLETVETILTGESRPVKKCSAVLQMDERTDGFPANMVFAGTSVSCGRGRAVVVSTGMHTQLGKIAASVGKRKNTQTDMQKGAPERQHFTIHCRVCICVCGVRLDCI